MEGASTSDVENDAGSEGGLRAYLSWKDLTMKVSGDKTILQNLSGFAEPARLLAIMGPSGSGKTSLLSTLSGRPSNDATITGQIMLNGAKADLSYGSAAAYLAQDVALLGTLTVYETLYYSAKCRFPDRVSDSETKSIVQNAIREVGLQECVDSRIGTWSSRGISGGEKRRVSIAVELLTSPYLLFLDEPTSGLDSASAFHVIRTLKGLAEDGGRTVLCSIHQPSSEVFELFDELCLLSDGRQVYNGPLPQAYQFFQKNGFPCPPVRSPSDHYLHCVNSDFDKVERILERQISRTKSSKLSSGQHPSMADDPDKPDDKSGLTAKEVVDLLAESFKRSPERKRVDEQVDSISHMKDTRFREKDIQASFVKQCVYLTTRSFLNMHRDIGYYWLRGVMYMILAVALGTIFHDLGRSFGSIQARASVLTFFVAFLSFMAIGGFPSFIEDMKVFASERLNGHYRVGAFVVGNSLSSLPFIFAISALSSTLVYPFVKFNGGFVHILFFVLNLFGCLSVAEAMLMAVASLVPHFLLGIILGAGVQGILILVSGFFRLPNDIPHIIWKYPLYYMDYISFAFQGFMLNEFKQKTFDGFYRTDPIITGRYVVTHLFDIRYRSKWLNLAILWAMVVMYRVIFYLLLKGKEKIFPEIGIQLRKRAAATLTIGSRPGSPSNNPNTVITASTSTS